MGIPTPTEINDACPQHILEGMDGPLTLPISLRMERRTKMQSRTQFLVELLPKTGSKSDIPIGNDRNWNPMARNNLADV